MFHLKLLTLKVMVKVNLRVITALPRKNGIQTHGYVTFATSKFPSFSAVLPNLQTQISQ